MKRIPKILITSSAIIAVVAVATSVGSMASQTPTAPDKVTGVSTSLTTTTVSLNWPAPYDGGSNITSYTVHWTSPNAAAQTETVNATTWTSSGFAQKTWYTLKVRATNGEGNGPWSDTVNAALIIPVPAKVTGLSVSANSTAISASWSEPANNGFPITSYTVQWITISGDQKATVNGTSWAGTEFEQGTLYTFRVLATNSAGDGPYSDTVNAQLTSNTEQ